MSDCEFCDIIRGEGPRTFIYEDELVVAFDDRFPRAPVHTLIVPRSHYVNLNDPLPDATVGALFRAVQRVAAIKGVADSGYRVIVNNGADARQTVLHLHLHLVGGGPMDHSLIHLRHGGDA